jgi:hypothetical protein
VSPVRPPGIGPDELVDGVEFDDELLHEEPSPGPSNVFVQVHNRGSFDAPEVRVVVLWADASSGPPRLPDDFWARHAAGLLADPVGVWTLVGDHTFSLALLEHVRPGQPRVHAFPVVWPPDLATRKRIGILVLVSNADDPLAGGQLDVATLLASERKVAYREMRTRSEADDNRLFLEQTGAAQFFVAAPPGPATSALAALGLAAVGPVAEVAGGSEPFVLNVGAPQSLVVRTAPQFVALSIPAGADIANLALATAREVASVLNRQFLVAGLPIRCDRVPVALPPPGGFVWHLRLRGVAEAQITLGAVPPPATNALPNLGLPAGGPVAQVVSALPEPYVINVGAPQSFTITVTNQATIAFTAADVVNLAAVSARDVRGIVNRSLRTARLPVRAIVPDVELWVRRSITDVDGRPAVVAGRELADLVAEPAAVPPGAGRTALFDLVRVHGADLIRRGVDNFLYLRSANLGNVPQVDARHRLFTLDLGAAPIPVADLPGGPVVATVPGDGSTIVEFTWNPGPVAGVERLFVLAVCDHDPDRPLAVPNNFANIEELDAFCQRNPNAAYRAFVVAP